MKQDIRHRRLHAFFQSKVLNSLMLVIIVCFLLMASTGSILLPVICESLALLLFIGYSLWLWIKKPKRITINNRLSDINGMYTLYFLIIIAMKVDNQWWYFVPIALSVILFFLILIGNQDKEFEI